jgi:LmbE family N-acetylglucosaminyl deacetylase
MKKYLKILLHLNNLRKSFGHHVISAAIKSEIKLEIMENAPAGKCLVLAPHPDDDIFGCGGIVSKANKNTQYVTTVYLTNGKNVTRKREAEQASKILGTTNTSFLDYSDGNLAAESKSIEMIKKIIEGSKPNIIFVPSLSDPHPDHNTTCEILAKALKSIDYAGEIWQYEVWQPLYANRLVTIDSVITQKTEAITAHKSQLEDRSYLEAILGLNKYRAGMYSAGKYAEGFFASNKELYLKLYEISQK